MVASYTRSQSRTNSAVKRKKPTANPMKITSPIATPPAAEGPHQQGRDTAGHDPKPSRAAAQDALKIVPGAGEAFASAVPSRQVRGYAELHELEHPSSRITAPFLRAP